MLFADLRTGNRSKRMTMIKTQDKSAHQGNLYTHTAYLYDADSRALVKDDVQFYLEYARQTGGKILELACGTGRVTIPVAQHGHWIMGIDLSDTMLEIAREKTARLPSPPDTLQMVAGDMTDFTLDHRFSLVIIPVRGFQALMEKERQNACLQCAARHMEGDGRFIITLMKPIPYIERDWVTPEETFDWEGTVPFTGEKVRRFSRRTAIDPERQTVSVKLIYYVEPVSAPNYAMSEDLKLRYFHPEQAENMLEKNGFHIEDRFGYYDRCPVNENSELIYVCKLS
jgi:ubiquinone/menaquinone biosynthesis C-methylase UbiE